MSKKSAIYIRVSTTHQIDKDSLPLQRKDLINYSKFVLGIEDYEVFEDAGYSGKNTDRPQFKEMIKRIKEKEFSHLLVWKIDRISRNLIDFCNMYEEIKKHNCIFISKNEQFDTSSAMGEAMLKIILVFAELERKLTAERVSAIMIDRATKGLWNGGPMPFGYNYNTKENKIEIVKDDADIILKIFNLYSDLQSTSLVRNFLNKNNYKSANNKIWTAKTISRAIRNPCYKGTYRYNHREQGKGAIKKESDWIVIENNHTPIISLELWERCNKIMDENSKNSNYSRFRKNVAIHLFSSLLYCSQCNSLFFSRKSTQHKDGYIPSSYICNGQYNKNGCTQKSISDKVLCEFVFTLISNIIRISTYKRIFSVEELEKTLLEGKCFEDIIGIGEINEVYNSIYYSRSESFSNKNKKEISIEDDHITNELNKYKRAYSRLEDVYLFDDESMSKKEYIIKKNKILDKIKELELKINERNSIKTSTTNSTFLIDVSFFELSNFLNSKDNIKIKDLLTTVNKDILKEFINTIISKIYIDGKKVKSITFKNNLTLNFIYN